MKKSRFTDSQIIVILKQIGAGMPVSELCREYGMSSASFLCPQMCPQKTWLSQ